MHRVSATIAFLMTVALAAAARAGAADTGDAARGHAVAVKSCAECHGIEASDKSSPNYSAPTFVAVAGTPGMTGTALVVWMQSPHPSMPNLILPLQERNDVIAYILSLKAR